LNLRPKQIPDLKPRPFSGEYVRSTSSHTLESDNRKPVKKIKYQPEYFVSPIGQSSAQGIATYLSLPPGLDNLRNLCYFGNRRARRDMHPVLPDQLRNLKSSEFSFFTFCQQTKYGRKQFINSHNVSGKEKETEIEKSVEALKS
jgi:hypothetical protein